MVRLKEILLNEDEVDDTFGNVAFGKKTSIAQYQGATDIEDNSELEELLYTHLKKWTDSKSFTDRADAAEQLYKHESLFRRAQNKFPLIFKPKTSNGTTLYRGLAVFNNNILSQLRDLKRKDYTPLKIDGEHYWLHPNNVAYTPENNLQSWTPSEKVARVFSDRRLGKYERYSGGVLITKQNDEFLFNQDFMHKLFGAPGDEQEILHFGKEYSQPIQLAIHHLYFVYKLFPLK
jgi:hypothetical protein